MLNFILYATATYEEALKTMQELAKNV